MVFPPFLKPSAIIALSAGITAAILFALLWWGAVLPVHRQDQDELQKIAALEGEAAAGDIQRYLSDSLDRSALLAAPIRNALTQILRAICRT